MSVEILIGDAIVKLREMPANSVHCVVTSPPYFGLRQYVAEDAPEKPFEIGLEESPDAWCARLVEVFREVRRVLRPDGQLWLNIGDSYASGEIGRHDRGQTSDPACGRNEKWIDLPRQQRQRPSGLKTKDLVGQPWLLAFSLRADGWWLRSEIIWAKPNPMPESVTDRPTKAHEQIFLLTKSSSYFYDAEAVREKMDEETRRGVSFRHPRYENGHAFQNSDDVIGDGRRAAPGVGRNARSVWTIATEPFSEAHFAVYPQELVRRCILAGTSAKGCCPACAAPWARVVEHNGYTASTSGNTRAAPNKGHLGAAGERAANMTRDGFIPNCHPITQTTGWRPTCACDAGDPAPATCLDPFGGSGTTGLVADQLGRNAILIELNPTYADMARRRVDGARARRLIGDVTERTTTLPGQLGLFE